VSGVHAAEAKGMDLTLHVWRQSGPGQAGKMVDYAATDISPDMSFLEMLDVVNERLIESGTDPIAFDHDCREGICGACGLMINGAAHGPMKLTTACQLHMRSFKDGDEIWIEPWRAKAFPVVKDLVVDRSAFDRIIQAGGFISAPTGTPQDANALPIGKPDADLAMDNAACIGCGACVAACPNASASLFTAAKITHLAVLPQGQPERHKRARAMVERMDLEEFGGCSLYGECMAACPKGISIDAIQMMNRDYLLATATQRDAMAVGGGE
jgi:succinate dehydrogenase / fumarate reductase iron-sulfur subunit